MELYDSQLEAVEKIRTGSILCGGVGSGKSRTALYYYFKKVCRGNIKVNGSGSYNPRLFEKKLYIITTAKKRNSLEWEKECIPFLLEKDKDYIVDSWNNIKKYNKVYGAFFIFDEQRVVGSGAWVKAFLDIARKNDWILLSATPGDKWSDYIPVFVANGFYKNKTDFNNRHAVFRWTGKYYDIIRYVDEWILEKYRSEILVPMDRERLAERHDEFIYCEFDRMKYKMLIRTRFDEETQEPIEDASKLLYLLRKVVNSDKSRIDELRRIIYEKKKAIIFYNYTYEWELLKEFLDSEGIYYTSYNGKVHESTPVGHEMWCYLVQYGAGSEGWNCISSDTTVFFSQTYSYRQLEQAHGRIDRVNTPFKDLYYYHLISRSPIDMTIRRALENKKDFNQRAWYKRNS